MSRKHTLRSQSGFTLVEIILVLAISSTMLTIAFVGQRQLRSRAQFDAAIEKVVSSISNAQNQATAGVNTQGSGDGLAAGMCPTGPSPTVANPVVFAGTTWTIDGKASAPSVATISIDYYKAIPGLSPASACIFDSQSIGLPSDVSLVGAAARRVAGLVFMRTNNGSLDVCPLQLPTVPAFQAQSRQAFVGSACPNAALTFTLQDTEGHISDIQVDPSGLAKRLN